MRQLRLILQWNSQIETPSITPVPALAPILPAIQDDNTSLNVAAALANYDGSLETLLDGNETTVPNVPVVVKVSHKGRISFKDVGVVGSSSLYLKQGVDKNIAADHRTTDSYLRGIITELPNNKNNNSYQIKKDTSSSKVPIDVGDLQTSFFKDDHMYNIMKIAQIKHDKQCKINLRSTGEEKESHQ